MRALRFLVDHPEDRPHSHYHRDNPQGRTPPYTCICPPVDAAAAVFAVGLFVA